MHLVVIITIIFILLNPVGHMGRYRRGRRQFSNRSPIFGNVINGNQLPIIDILIHVKDGLIWHVTMKKHLMKVVIEAGCMHLKYIITSLLLNASLLLPVVIPLFVHQSK